MENISAEEPKIKESFTTVTTLSKILAGIFFIGLPFLGFYLGYNFQKAPTIVIQQQTTEEEKPKEIRQQTGEIKKSFYGGEIPVSWSQYANYEAAPLEDVLPKTDSAKFSFSDIRVSFSDWNGTQVDFFLMTEAARNKLLDNAKELAKEEAGIVITEEKIGGVSATIINWPLDNGEVTKAGSGGSSYVIKLGYKDYAEYLLIEKQAKGDEMFEQAIIHYLKTADFTKNTVI